MAYDLDRSDAERLSLLMRSGHGLIVMETHEERRGVRLVMEAAASIEQRCWAWSLVRGLVPLDRREGQMASGTNDPTAALLHLISLTDRWVAIMADLQRHLDDPKVIRAAREAAEQAHRNGSTLVLLGPAMELPAELQRLAFPFPLTLPDTAFFEKLVKRVYREVLADNQQIGHELKREDFTRLTESLIGLTEIEAERIIRQVILEDGRLDARDVDRVRNAKRATIASHGQLEVLPVADNLDSLGGHDRLKDWLRKRRAAMSSKGREFGIEPPRGVLLLGVPGCGKSFCARLVAGEWRRPLLRLDVGGLYNRFIGNTEHNLREALRQADSMAPCVLWIDEIEKAFASEGGGDADGGVSQRLFGTMLTWMNDRRSDVFIIATANQVHRLPTELLRKGRFDEIFFIDLPPPEARQRIFEIHLSKRGRLAQSFDIETLAALTEGFSGAEIEQLIVDALHGAFSANEQLATHHVVEAVGRTKPMAVTMAERIASMRQWAESRCTMSHGD